MTSSLSGLAPSLIGGPCGLCGKEHRLAVDPVPAREALQALFDVLEAGPSLAAERTFLAASRGKMIGVLIGTDGGGAPVRLKSFSGELGGREDWEGWVPAVVRREATAELEAQTLLRLARLDGALAGAPTEQGAALRRERRRTSAHLMRAMLDAVHLTNAARLRLPLRRVFAGGGIPSGTATCGLPKLLSAANHLGVTPVSVAEAWWGPSYGEREHGKLGAPCARRCLPILGYLLCREERAEDLAA